MSFRSSMLLRTLLNRLLTRPSAHRRHLSLSSVEGALEPPLASVTLSQYFQAEILGKHSSRPALICRNEAARAHGGPPSRNLGITSHLAWDFEEFDRHINALTRGLLAMGVKRGDRVGVLMGNNSAYAMLQWACASIGAILVTINPAYRINELANVLNLAGVSHFFVVPRIRSSSYLEMLANKFPELRNSSPGAIQEPLLPQLRNLVVIDNTGQFKQGAESIGLKSWIDWREIMVWDESSLESALQREISKSLHKDDVINLQFTSGTTGAPKAVSLTHFNLLNNGLSIGRCMYLSEADVVCNVPPLFHCFGLVLGNLAAWTHGACIVYPSEIFDPKAIVDAVVQEKCSALHGVPTHFLGVLAEVDRRRANGEPMDMQRLRTGIAAGSPIPIELMKKLRAQLNLVDLTNAYGMSETSPVSFQTVPADPVIKRVETVGRVQPHVKAKLLDPDGNIVPVGTPGEICIAGYLLQKGYWGDEEQTRQVMRTDPEDGTVWMHTGDEGILDDEGYLRVVSRIKDIIIRGGENLFPVQIENVILTNPEIEEAAVVSVPDDKYGEVVGAWIVRKAGSSISRQAVRATVSQLMNPQNAPTWVFFVGEDGAAAELPKTASGKVMKHILRDWSRDLASRKVGLVV
ncbi:acyl-CoA synthetase [Mycena latifolia]|nr:acyl-CoA synthetase [Mycena latifolia]